ncbi:MAG TPA: hypothetical protein ENK18_19510 [Deltaproteobacteria bacterium]|nr:hypothetical protein [Deltaproteobacteria bacterium]
MGEPPDLPTQATGFLERYDPWTGRAWLELRGPEPARIPLGSEGYAQRRRALRQRFADRPFSSEWADGRFPPAPAGLPVYPVLVLSWLAGSGACGLAAFTAGPLPAAGVALGLSWPLVRMLDAVHVIPRGIRIGPPWAPCVSWHEIEAVGVYPRWLGARVWVRHARGQGSATIPRVLVPALRARVRRLGALSLRGGDGGIASWYARWRVPAMGGPWGLLVGTLVACWLTPWPWLVLAVGLAGVAVLVVLSSAIEARASGWGAGSVLWLTLLYALFLAALAVVALQLPT